VRFFPQRAQHRPDAGRPHREHRSTAGLHRAVRQHHCHRGFRVRGVNGEDMPEFPILQVGDSGTEVGLLQSTLTVLGFDVAEDGAERSAPAPRAPSAASSRPKGSTLPAFSTRAPGKHWPRSRSPRRSRSRPPIHRHSPVSSPSATTSTPGSATLASNPRSPTTTCKEQSWRVSVRNCC
jgi:hypothetical protein